MILPVLLRGERIEEFRKHLLDFGYHHLVNAGKSSIDNSFKNFTTEETNAIVESFIDSDFPIVCLAGNKSSIPFWDYHVALNYSNNTKEVMIYELLAREPKEENCLKGIFMAFYFLSQKRFEIERIVVPFIFNSEEHVGDVLIEKIVDKNKTILRRRE